MVAAICYAWLLENRMRDSKKEDDEEECVVVPVMNVRRGNMWKLLRAAWLFHYIGIDATSLLFSDEVFDLSFILLFSVSLFVTLKLELTALNWTQVSHS